MHRHDNHVQGERASLVFQGLVNEWGWTWQAQIPDYGIDGHVELFRFKKTTSLDFKVQLKSYSGHGPPQVRVSNEHLSYWLKMQSLVLLIYCDLNTNKVYGKWASAFTPLEQAVAKKSTLLKFSERDLLTFNSSESIYLDVKSEVHLPEMAQNGELRYTLEVDSNIDPISQMLFTRAIEHAFQPSGFGISRAGDGEPATIRIVLNPDRLHVFFGARSSSFLQFDDTVPKPEALSSIGVGLLAVNFSVANHVQVARNLISSASKGLQNDSLVMFWGTLTIIALERGVYELLLEILIATPTEAIGKPYEEGLVEIVSRSTSFADQTSLPIRLGGEVKRFLEHVNQIEPTTIGVIVASIGITDPKWALRIALSSKFRSDMTTLGDDAIRMLGRLAIDAGLMRIGLKLYRTLDNSKLKNQDHAYMAELCIVGGRYEDAKALYQQFKFEKFMHRYELRKYMAYVLGSVYGALPKTPPYCMEDILSYVNSLEPSQRSVHAAEILARHPASATGWLLLGLHRCAQDQMQAAYHSFIIAFALDHNEVGALVNAILCIIRGEIQNTNLVDFSIIVAIQQHGKGLLNQVDGHLNADSIGGFDREARLAIVSLFDEALREYDKGDFYAQAVLPIS